MVFTAPYGKTINYSFGPLVPARISWCLMEGINLIWCIICWNENRVSKFEKKIPYINLFLLSLFFIHYIQRAIIYPYLMSNKTTRMPLFVVIYAALFCTFNG